MSGLANKKILKRSGLIGGVANNVPLSGKDMSVAATRMPSFDFAQSQPTPVAASEPAQALGIEAVFAAVVSAPFPPILAVEKPQKLDAGHIVRLKIDQLVDSPFQPRLIYDESKLVELAESLQNRQIDPLMVRPVGEDRFEIISGHRRKRAAPLAQLDELDCRIIEVDDSHARVLVLAANESREDFTDYERALAYRGILDEGKRGGTVRSQKQLAAQIGVDAALVNRRLSMLELPEAIQDVLRSYPAAFSCRWVKKLLELTALPYDADRLKAALMRVATDELQMVALFSVMAGAGTIEAKGAPQRGLSLHRGNKVFAQVTPNMDKRHVVVKLPGDCDIQEVAELILSAIGQRFGSMPSSLHE